MATKENQEQKAAFDFDALKAEHGEKHVRLVPTALGPVVVRTPSEGSLDRFMSEFLDGNGAKKIAANRQLALDCVVWPSKEDFRAMCKEKPGIPLLIGNKAQELAGMQEVEEGKG